MFSALFSFLGGTAFRMIWGEVSAYFSKKQEHNAEMERMRLSETLEQSRHTRQKELVSLQHQLGLQTIQLQGDIESEKLAAEAFIEAQKNFKPTGIRWVDAWNAAIRPTAASVALALWSVTLWKAGFTLTPWDLDLIGAIMGFYFADRSLKHRGK